MHGTGTTDTPGKPSATPRKATRPKQRRPAGTALDGRTREYKLLNQTKADLTAQLGGTAALSAAQRVMVDRAARLTLHLAMMDARTTAGSTMTDHDSRQYLAWTNSLSKLLRHLGLEAKAKKASSLRDHIAAHTASAA